MEKVLECHIVLRTCHSEDVHKAVNLKTVVINLVVDRSKENSESSHR